MLLPVQTMLYNSHPALHAPVAEAVANADLPSPLTTGIACYAIGLIALSAWEKWAVPSLKLNSILPDMPLLPGQLSEAEKRVAFITPCTSSMSTPPPTLEDLRTRGKYLVGRVDDMHQFISCATRPHVNGVSIRSPEWSAYYDADVTIYKARMS